MHTGQQCDKCQLGWYVVYSTHTTEFGKQRVSYFRCWSCKHKPDDNKVVILAPPRKPRRIRSQD